jgi:hypothetical protein
MVSALPNIMKAASVTKALRMTEGWTQRLVHASHETAFLS